MTSGMCFKLNHMPVIKDRVDRLNKNDGDVRNCNLARHIKFLND